MAHITIPEGATIQGSTRVSYAVTTATTGPFSVPFPYFDSGDITVYVDEIVQAEGTAYTLTGTPVESGFSSGSITFASSISNADLVIQRDVPIERTSDFSSSGPFPMPTLNTQLDQAFAVLQQLRTSIARALTLADSDPTSNLVIPNVDDRKGKYLHFNSTTGDPEATAETDSITTTVTAFAQTFLDDPDAATVRRTIGVRNNLLDYAADPVNVILGTIDASAAFDAANAATNNYYVPPGTYRFDTTVNFVNKNVYGASPWSTRIVGNLTDTRDPVICISKNSTLRDMEISYDSSDITGSEGEGERVLIRTWEDTTQSALSRGSSLKHLRLLSCGTAIADGGWVYTVDTATWDFTDPANPIVSFTQKPKWVVGSKIKFFGVTQTGGTDIDYQTCTVAAVAANGLEYTVTPATSLGAVSAMSGGSAQITSTSTYSVSYEDIEINEYSYRGVDFQTTERTNNSWNNIYITGGSSATYEPDIGFNYAGQESGGAFGTLNVEGSAFDTAAAVFSGQRALAGSLLHLEAIDTTATDKQYLKFEDTSADIQSINVLNTGMSYNNTAIIELGSADYAIPTQNNPTNPSNDPCASMLNIGTYHTKGIAVPNTGRTLFSSYPANRTYLAGGTSNITGFNHLRSTDDYTTDSTYYYININRHSYQTYNDSNDGDYYEFMKKYCDTVNVTASDSRLRVLNYGSYIRDFESGTTDANYNHSHSWNAFYENGGTPELTTFLMRPWAFTSNNGSLSSTELALGEAGNHWSNVYTKNIRFGTRATAAGTNGDVKILTGTATPEGAVVADIGSLFLRTDGGTASTLYVKEAGDGLNTGWAAV